MMSYEIYLMRLLCIPLIAVLISFRSAAQTNRGLTDLPSLIPIRVSGAPALSQPVLVKGTDFPIVSEGYGWAAPAFYDWDEDGLKDLIIGEFGSGVEHGKYVGNFIRVFQNVGTQEEPSFTGQFNYARPLFPRTISTNGTPYSVDQFCCIGFTPQFIDLNADGRQDLITGNYWGEVSWFQGSDMGILPGQILPQEGNPKEPDLKKYIDNQWYWIYSPASFGDFTNDELPDLIVGGSSLRISRNIGTKTEPRFGKRELLLDIAGNPLTIEKVSALGSTATSDTEGDGLKLPVGGDRHLRPLVVDWDNDGVHDLLVATSYSRRGLEAVYFFKGVKSGVGFRFLLATPLFKSSDGGKVFPGCSTVINVTDWNSDGIDDLLIGVSVVTVRGDFSSQLSWNWEMDLRLKGVGKDPMLLSELSEKDLKRHRESTQLPPGVSFDDYMTVRHKGYVYVLLGKRNP